MVDAFADKTKILGIIKLFRRNFTIDNINIHLHELATTKVVESLFQYGYYNLTNADDIADLLEKAELCFYMEFAGMTREIENAMGVIGEETIDGYTKKYENGMPMFFFASGGTEAFLELLPHETWRMAGFRYVAVFCSGYWAINENDGISAVLPSSGNMEDSD